MIPREFVPGAGLVAVETVLLGAGWIASNHGHHTIAFAAVLVALLIGVMAVALIAGAIRRNRREQR